MNGTRMKTEIAFFHPYRVRWADVDPQNIVFNPNYYVFFDDGWNEYLRQMGFPFPRGLGVLGIDFVVARSEATFHASARFDDELLIGVRIIEFGRTSLKVQFTVWRDEALLNEGSITYVAVDQQTHRPVPVPLDLIRRVIRFETVAPAERTRVEAWS